ncbi:MAG: fumarylacetoacetate hydrolase family protein [Bacteroidetes bacterium]|nr:fumarylacetoacetate hydrolase family protein [Bacteroidota bacterium]
MKLVRFGNPSNEKPGVLVDSGKILDVSPIISDYDEKFFGGEGISRLKNELVKGNLSFVSDGQRLGAPIARPSKIICVGLNYLKHARESNMAVPTEPIIFFKATSSIVGPDDEIIIPKGSAKTDWEVELAVVIGKKASYVSEEDALNHVAGYMLHNDVSERAFQLERGGQWVKGKSADSFAPLGPWMVTADEIKDPHNLRLWLKLNGKMLQDESTSDMIFKVPFLVSYISQFMTLLPGDVISTGTPAGVGLGFNPPVYLKDGDVIELGIDGLGKARQNVVSFEKARR